MTESNWELPKVTADFLNNISANDLSVLIKYTEPNNRFLNYESKGLNGWGFGDVMNLNNNDLLSASKELLNKEFGVTEKDILKSNSKDYVSFLSFVRKQFENASKLMDTLGSDSIKDDDAKELDKYGIIGLYYSIDKNPLSWDSIAKLPFIVIFTKLSIDNTVAKIEKKRQKNELDRINRQNKR